MVWGWLEPGERIRAFAGPNAFGGFDHFPLEPSHSDALVPTSVLVTTSKALVTSSDALVTSSGGVGGPMDFSGKNDSAIQTAIQPFKTTDDVIAFWVVQR